MNAESTVIAADPVGAPSALDRPFPRAIEVATLSLACVVVGGVWLGAHTVMTTSMTFPAVLLAVAASLLAVAVVMVSRVKGFSWNTFRRVGRWALLAYCVSAGMIEFAFVHNKAPHNVIQVVSGMLVVFALDVPFLIATTVARYHQD
ncbi:MAG: hypothetical protein F2681_14635 [Actinobacteria bacterium]|uniref:Unannotated protein n=1 Tax=freshwater metagenome TaxID=449393 RepID=A0A6J7ATK1_9ZZZZ|nr:hypothetical protein [Actinomycetota bacterium]MSW79388.1 hypothetical protein [Actinomycetota bacterium]MSX56709.1 hypothetical protein [Actinomycetota bacterium]MSX94779.1 hypothetical protein [Actinomycetota bacterium]MSZ84370.1 hypothetical protein [Actinomycetota bacterium]